MHTMVKALESVTDFFHVFEMNDGSTRAIVTRRCVLQLNDELSLSLKMIKKQTDVKAIYAFCYFQTTTCVCRSLVRIIKGIGRQGD
jgi:hypothetical protein